MFLIAKIMGPVQYRNILLAVLINFTQLVESNYDPIGMQITFIYVFFVILILRGPLT